jgi:hypothetical protein
MINQTFFEFIIFIHGGVTFNPGLMFEDDGDDGGLGLARIDWI